MDLFDDFDPPPPISDREAIELAGRMCDKLMRENEEYARDKGWQLLARCGPGLSVWKDTHGNYWMDTPKGRERIDG